MRTPAARAFAERALAVLALHLGDHARHVVVIGGLNAELLTVEQDPPHQGTVDVDVLLEVGFVFDREDADFGWLEAALVAAGFRVTPGDQTWRWWLDVDGLPVRLELLCDTPDNRGQQIVLPGCATATAMNLSGPAAAQSDAVIRRLPVAGIRAHSGLPVEVPGVDVRFAGLGGYLLAKAAAVTGRDLDKDLYDFAFVVLHNRAGGPIAAARAAAAAIPAASSTDYRAIVRAAVGRFVASQARGARVYAEQRQRDGEATDPEIIAQDAVGAAKLFWREFDPATGPEGGEL